MRAVLGSGPAYTCPLASSPRPTAPFHSGSLSYFHQVERHHRDFDISIAYSLDACNQFRLKIKRNDVSVCHHPVKVSNNAVEQDYATKVLGPDTFELRIDGAERFAMSTPSRFSKVKCEYEYDVRLNTPGAVWLTGTHIFEVGFPIRCGMLPDCRLDVS